jgi:small subunit ribosomal protein S11
MSNDNKKKGNDKKQNQASASTQKKRVKNLASITVAKFHILATKNNTIVVATDPAGNALVGQISSGKFYRGAKKSTPFAAKDVTTKLLEQIYSLNIKTIDVIVKGIGSGRDAAVESIKNFCLNNSNFIVNSIADATPFPHNGCRAPKKRRV